MDTAFCISKTIIVSHYDAWNRLLSAVRIWGPELQGNVIWHFNKKLSSLRAHLLEWVARPRANSPDSTDGRDPEARSFGSPPTGRGLQCWLQPWEPQASRLK